MTLSLSTIAGFTLLSSRVEHKVSKKRCPVFWVILLAASSGWMIAPAAFAAEKVPSSTQHLIRFEDLENATDAYGAFALSPDGRAVAFTQRDSVLVKETRRYSAPLNIGVGFSPRWSPDGSRLAYLSKVTGKVQLWIYDIRARSTRRVTAFPDGVDPDPLYGWLSLSMDGAFRYDWSPDGTKIVFGSRVPGRDGQKRNNKTTGGVAASEYAPLVLDGTTPSDLTVAGIFRQGAGAQRTDGHNLSVSADLDIESSQQLFIVELDDNGQKISQLTAGVSGYFDPAWSPDGTMIACATTHGRIVDGNLESADILLVDSSSGKVLKTTAGKGIKYLPSWSAHGNQVVYAEIPEEGPFGVPELDAWDFRSGLHTALTPDLDRRVLAYQIDKLNDAVVFLYRDGRESVLRSVGLDGGATRSVRREAESRIVANFVLDTRGHLAFSIIGNEDPGFIELLNSAGGKPKTIVELNPEAENWLIGRRHPIHWTNERGDKLDGIVIEPPGFDPSKPYPTIVDAYPFSSGGGWSVLAGNQAWASKGYLVFIPAPRGPHVWMNSWSARSYGLVARGANGWEVTQDDLMSGVNALVSRGLIDRNRVCIYGHSNGGAVALNVIARTDAFACAVAVAPVMLDWLSQASLRSSSTTWMTRFFGSKSVFDDAESYLKLSVVYRASAIHTPTLLAVGDGDQVETVLGTVAMYTALRYVGQNVTFLRYPDQNHVFRGEAMRDLWERELRFFDAYLGNGRDSSTIDKTHLTEQ
jgi:dipeptidyl aminopeptidase/acylaminoacyl peptidase